MIPEVVAPIPAAIITSGRIVDAVDFSDSAMIREDLYRTNGASHNL